MPRPVPRPLPEFPFDHEWYVVCDAREVKRGRAHRVQLFDHGVVVWRDVSGALHA